MEMKPGWLMAAALVWAFELPVQAQHRLQVTVMPGYSTENFQWSIAGNSAGLQPNVYSELIWRKIQRIGVGVTGSWYFHKNFLLHIRFAKNYTIAGKATDTDYREDNRKSPSYNGSFNSNKGGSALLEAAPGYAIDIGKTGRLTLCPGYTFNRQAFYLLPADAFTPAGLKSTYTATWKGLMFSTSFRKNFTDKIYMEPAFRYYQVKYNAAANWNLIPQFRHPLSFVHTANAFGVAPSLKLGYSRVYLHLQYSYLATGRGTEHLYLAAGGDQVTQLNGAAQSTLRLAIGVIAW